MAKKKIISYVLLAVLYIVPFGNVFINPSKSNTVNLINFLLLAAGTLIFLIVQIVVLIKKRYFHPKKVYVDASL